MRNEEHVIDNIKKRNAEKKYKDFDMQMRAIQWLSFLLNGNFFSYVFENDLSVFRYVSIVLETLEILVR
jgi:hypothetical protein